MKVNTINEGVSVSHAWCHAISIILPSVKTYMFVIPLFFKKLLIDLRERENCCSTYLCIPWLILACVLTGDPTCNLGASGWHSNQLSYPSRHLCFSKEKKKIKKCSHKPWADFPLHIEGNYELKRIKEICNLIFQSYE